MIDKRFSDAKAENNASKSIIGIFLSVVVFWICIFLFKNIVTGIPNTIINIISLGIAIAVLLSMTDLKAILGNTIVSKTIIVSSVIVLCSLIFSCSFVFNDFLSGDANALSHGEHALMYKEMEIIATRLSDGKTLEQATAGLPLEQYYNIFVYSSMLFFFGGVNITNMCLWSMLHSVICAVCMVLMSYKFGVTDKSKLNVIYMISLLQPLLLAVHNYNKVIIGQAFLMLAMYIYILTYRKPLLNLLFFPVYAYLMWSVRLQYLLVAAVLCIIMFFINNNRLNLATIFEASVVVFVTAILFMSMNVGEFINEELNFQNYTEGSDYSIAVLPMRLLRSILPYFPFTNILTDVNWTFNIYCILQIALNIVMWYLVISRGVRKKRIKEVFKNPMILAAIGFLLAGLFSALHTTYISVGTIFLSSEFEDDVTINRIIINSIFVFFAITLLSVIYTLLGLTGTAASGIVI